MVRERRKTDRKVDKTAKKTKRKQNSRTCVFYYLTKDWIKEVKELSIDGEVIKYLENMDYKGEYGDCKAYNSPDIDVVFVGLGKLDNGRLPVHKLKDLGGLTGSIAKTCKCQDIVCNIPGKIKDKEIFAREITFGIFYSASEFNYKVETKEKDRTIIHDLKFLDPTGRRVKGPLINAIREGYILAENVNYIRKLIETPSNMKTPEKISKIISKKIKQNEILNKVISIKMLKQRELKRLGMNGVLAVAQGSANKPVVMILEYGQRYKKKGTVCLVGKGVTFDSGGISLKPGDMDDMKRDMSGAAAVLGGLLCLARMGIAKHAVGLLGFVENMPSGTAQRPGDVIKLYNGKTIEVKNTDAEGRLVLSDLLAYADKNYKPEYIIDFATLTGAVIVALGHRCAGVMGNNSNLIFDIISAGERSGDRCWQLPLWDEYDENIESKIADYVNIGSPSGAAGPIIGAMLLKHFVSEKTPWAHVDIAGTAWYDKKKPFSCSGATGFGVRLIYELIKGEG